MKYIFIGLFILSSIFCKADCDAPALNLEVHQTDIYGFKILKLWNDDKDAKADEGDTKISFGDYEFLIKASRAKLPKPKEVKLAKAAVVKKILKVLKSNPHYLGQEKQQFSVSNVQGFDLQGKGEPDIILFEASPGANSYSGVIGLIKGKWYSLIQPVCY